MMEIRCFQSERVDVVAWIDIARSCCSVIWAAATGQKPKRAVGINYVPERRVRKIMIMIIIIAKRIQGRGQDTRIYIYCMYIVVQYYSPATAVVCRRGYFGAVSCGKKFGREVGTDLQLSFFELLLLLGVVNLVTGQLFCY